MFVYELYTINEYFEIKKQKSQPYIQFNSRQIDAIDGNTTAFGLGINTYLSRQHSKYYLVYKTNQLWTIHKNVQKHTGKKI